MASIPTATAHVGAMKLTSEATPPQGDLNSTLDSALLMPVRLFIVTLLAGMEWLDCQTASDSVGITRSALGYHVRILRREQIVETCRAQDHRMWVRLTPDGSQRLASHLESAQAIAARATELLTASTRRSGVTVPEARRRKARESVEVITYLTGRYKSGATIEALADETGLSYRRTRTTLIDAGVTPRPPRIRVPPCPPGMVNLYKSGATIRELANRYGHSYNQTRNMLLHAGVTLRPPGRPKE
jgi:DNA-binding MarR family transcriptional regulator/lambda repressor-like predicted transcriptional regulator